MLVQDYLLRSARLHPGKTAIVQNGRRFSYGDLLSGSLAVSSFLADAGIRKGDIIALLNDDPVDYVRTYFGALLAGGTVAGLNTDTTARTLEYQINRCFAAAVLSSAKCSRQIAAIREKLPLVRVYGVSGQDSRPDEDGFTRLDFSREQAAELAGGTDSSDIAQIIYTSGTTGSPSAVMLRHSNLAANTESIIKYLGLKASDSVMAVLPFFYSYGNSIMLTHFAVGGTLVINQNFLYPNVILEQMASEKVSGFSGVPSTFSILLNRSAVRQYSFPNLRYLTQAGGAMPPAVAREVKAVFPDADLFIMYGQTEASARLSYLEPSELFRKAGSIGKAIPGVTLEVLRQDGSKALPGEIGEIVASGENIMAGYLGEPEKSSQVLRDGRLWTGDLAKTDEEGFIFIVSRKSEIIKSGAHRVHPKEIEEILSEHASVEESAVVGVEDRILGECIKAVVVLKKGSECSRRDLLAHCHRLLPSYKVPHRIEFAEELPKTMSGKIKRAALKGDSQGAEAPGGPEQNR